MTLVWKTNPADVAHWDKIRTAYTASLNAAKPFPEHRPFDLRKFALQQAKACRRDAEEWDRVAKEVKP